MTEGQTWDKVRWCEIIIATDVMYYYDDDFNNFFLCSLFSGDLSVSCWANYRVNLYSLLFFLVSFPYSLSFCSTFWEDLCVPIYPSGLPWWFSGKESTCQCGRCRFDPWVEKIPLEKEMPTHSSIPAWEISWTEEPGGLQSMGLQKNQTRLN